MELLEPAQRLPLVEMMERRIVMSTAHHVLIISVDGLHGADVADPALQQNLTNIRALQQTGVTYGRASTSKPSDSFPGTLAYLTGAGPGTTGVFYDDSYDRALFAPGSAGKGTSNTPGTETLFDESIDKNQNLLSGGGNADGSSIDPAKLPVDKNRKPVYPHQFLKVNTIFNVAHDAGLHTAFGDKHPAYDIANGPAGNGVDDFYSPEINSLDALLDPATNTTVNADALLASNPFADVSKYKLVDPSTDPVAVDPKTGFSTDPNLQDPTTNTLLAERYDELKVQAALNEINGLDARGTHSAPVPNLFAFNFQEVSVAEKYSNGGISLLPDGTEVPSDVLRSALSHTDAAIGQIVAALKARNLFNSTALILTAKHGQTPRVGSAGLMADTTLPGVLSAAGAPVAQATQDDVSLFWLKDQAKTAAGVAALQHFKATGTVDVFLKGVKRTLPASQAIDQILSGPALSASGLGNPAANSRTPDIIVTLKPGYIWVGNPKKFKLKNAEHGGFSADDTHVALIVAGGGFKSPVRGQTMFAPVDTREIAVTALDALGLDPKKLKGAATEHTLALPYLDQRG